MKMQRQRQRQRQSRLYFFGHIQYPADDDEELPAPSAILFQEAIRHPVPGDLTEPSPSPLGWEHSLICLHCINTHKKADCLAREKSTIYVTRVTSVKDTMYISAVT